MMDVHLRNAFDTIDVLFERVCSLETSKRALTDSVIRLWQQLEKAEAENTDLRKQVAGLKARAA